MSAELLERLEEWKRRFEPAAVGELEDLLPAVARQTIPDAPSLIRLHETLLFLRAYPLSEGVARAADEILFHFAERTAPVDLEPFEEPDVSGIAGASLTAVYSYEVTRRLAELFPRDVEIGWDRYDEQDRLGPVLSRLIPMFREDWPVEAHVPFQQWMALAHPPEMSDLQWLLNNVASAQEFDALQVPLTWRISPGASRSQLRLPQRPLFLHREPLIRRSEVSLERELGAGKLRVTRVGPAESRQIIDLILTASATRFRELYGFTHPDVADVHHVEFGRGVEMYFYGVAEEWKLPLRGYQGGMFFKNGVPAGYVEVLSYQERLEVGFNLYYTFREGESAWLYAQLLRLFHQVLGSTCFSVDPYQIGHSNAEAVESGAFWFYRKLGVPAGGSRGGAIGGPGRGPDEEGARLPELEEDVGEAGGRARSLRGPGDGIR